MPVRRALESDWPIVRALRLRGLAEDPLSFGARLEDERDLPDARWRGWASAYFLAVRDGREVGLVRTQRVSADTHGIYSLWVAPEARRSGIARELLAAAERHVREAGAAIAELSVIDAAEAAQRLYEDAGYRRVRSQPSRHPGRLKITLQKAL